MRYPESIGYANHHFDGKPVERRTCKSIGNYIIKYIFYNDTANFEEKVNMHYKNILNTAIDELENNGFLTLKRLGEIADDEINGVNRKFDLWFNA